MWSTRQRKDATSKNTQNGTAAAVRKFKKERPNLNESSVWTFAKKHQDKLKLADPLGVKLLSHLRLDFSHLNQHNLGHCGAEVKTTQYFFLHWQWKTRQKLYLNYSSSEQPLREWNDFTKRWGIGHRPPGTWSGC